MSKKIFFTFFIAINLGCIAIAEDTNYLEKSRNASNKLMKTLKETLMSSLKNGDTSSALQVCSTMAQDMTKSIGESEGVEIKRVSLKYRNENDKPDKFEEEQLHNFQVLNQKKELTPNKEIFKEVVEGEKKYFRYMKPIVAGKTCLQCHGTNINPDVMKIINEKYPKDLATGHKEGDLRGAVSVKIFISNNN